MKSVKHFISFFLASLMTLSLVSCGGGAPASGTDSQPSTEESHPADSGQNFIIARDGKILVDIVLPQNASQKEILAANDLKAYLKKITGGNANIISENKIENGKKYILIGDTELSKSLGINKPTGYPDGERVIVKQTGDYLVFSGNDDVNYNGTQFAVTMFLEQLGCRWFADDELWQVTPTLKDIDATGIAIDHTPKFSSRITRFYSNCQSTAQRWFMGGEESITGHWLFQVAPASMYSTHPEWFALSGGSRNPVGKDASFQYCYSNGEFAEYIGEKLIEFFKANPLVVSMTVSPNDGWEKYYCECDACKALGNTSDCVVHFANNVAKYIAPHYPEKRVHFYSYHKTYEPPLNKVALEDNVEIMFCRETSMTRPLDEGWYKEGYDWITHNTYTCSWEENARKWIEQTNCKNVSVWEWYCLAVEREEWRNTPWIQGNVATRNQDLWVELGVDYVFYDHGPLDVYREDESSVALRWPLWYVAARSAWGGNMTGEELLLDACNKLYGNAAEEMFDYYKLLADASENCTAYSMTWIPPTVSEMYKEYKPKLLSAVSAIKKAKKDCTELEKERIDIQLEYWSKTLNLIG